ncbi:lymphocyte antigen 75 [Aplochiton taeniatus]
MDTFNIQHADTGSCLVVESPAGVVGLGPCNGSSGGQWWKWGSSHRLFHMDSARCLGLEVRSKALALFDCGSSGRESVLWWRCMEGAVYTVYQMSLNVNAGKVSAKRDTPDVWSRGGSQDNICRHPYQIVHTTNGNSAGAPCDFPFLYNGTWHHECLPDNDSPGLTWCATSSDYQTGAKTGTCLKPEEGCKALFTPASVKDAPCYEFVSGAAVTWQEALDSCRSQGADLLSVSSTEELTSLSSLDGFDNMPERMWIGLHQLDTSQGWQWSDGSPFIHLRWETGMPSASFLKESDCGVLNSKNSYESEACDKRLPYICKKENRTSTQESSVYKTTVCAKGWVPWSGMCYMLIKDNHMGFFDAQTNCKMVDGALVSIHSLDTIELISTSFHHSDEVLDVWIGLIGQSDPPVLKWVDNEPITFTYWGPNQPSRLNNTQTCVYYSGQSHGWKTGACGMLLPSMCQKTAVSETSAEAGCPPQGGWRRHGNSCYKVNPTEVPFKDHCDITIRNKFEQAFINSLLVEHVGRTTQYFWTGLQDTKNTGEYQWLSQDNHTDGRVTFTNWGWFEPRAQAGSCVVMSTAKPLGQWEVKNCTLFKAGTVCKRDLMKPPAPDPEPDPNLPCPKGWASSTGIRYCYKVFNQERVTRKRSWEEAERFCQSLGTNLASFSNDEEMRTLHYITRNGVRNDRLFWVGLNRRNPADRSWKWSNGRPVSMGILQQDFHEDDEYDRDCTAFKTKTNYFKGLFDFLLHHIPSRPFYAKPFHCDAQLEWVCQIPRGNVPKHPEWYNPGGHHESSIFADGREFWFVTEPRLNYEEATLYCYGNGSKLAAPQSLSSTMQIQEHLLTTPEAKLNWWADMRMRERFFPVMFTKMRYDTRFLGRCTSINPDYRITDYEYRCGQKLPFVCERHNVTLAERNTTVPHPAGLACGKKSLAFREKCYTVMKYIPFVDSALAGDVCQTVRGTLLTISDQVEQDFITTLLPALPVKTWIGLKLKTTNSEWVDHSPVSFLNFNPLLHGMLRPMLIDRFHPETTELCVFIIADPSSAMIGTWDYTSCSNQQYVGICQHYADKPQEPQVFDQPIQVTNHTFKLLHQNVSWFEALELCRNSSMDLASVADTLQQATLTVHVSRARAPMWIGLFSEDEGIHYRWTDHSHTVFSRWASEQGTGYCVYLDTDGFWKATECETVLEGAICHVPHEETKPEDIVVKCPHKINGPTWIPYKNNCYTFQLSSSRWSEFEKGQIHDTCTKLDPTADILTIRNAEENEFVKQQLKPFKSLVQFVWLGLFKDENDNKMKWYDGTNVHYSNWRDGRPQVDQKFMAGLNPDGTWNIFTDPIHFSLFEQRSIVACKLEKDSKEEYIHDNGEFERYGNLTYQVVTKKLNWFQALEECGRRGGHLASVHDGQHGVHMNLIARRDGFPLWIGLSSQDANASVYEWSDGTEYNYVQQLSDADGGPGSNLKGSCVFLTPSGGWVRENCHTQLEGAICYNTTITTPFQRAKMEASPETNHCPQSSGPSGWVQYEDHCYAFDMSFYNHSVYSMADAKAICQGLDARLLTIKTAEENTFVAKYTSENPYITSRIWLGMEMDPQGKPISWLDGSSVSFSNWEKEVTVAGGKTGTPCAVMVSTERGTWDNVSCFDSRSRVVCKTEAKSGGSPLALGFFVIVVLALTGAVVFIVYKKSKTRFFSTVRYERNFDEADSTSILTDAD